MHQEINLASELDALKDIPIRGQAPSDKVSSSKARASLAKISSPFKRT